MSRVAVSIEINGAVFDREIEPRMLLSDFIRHEARLTGTHVGCEHGVCGACTVQLDGAAVRSCLLLAVQAQGGAVRTVEGLAPGDGALHPLQQAFHETHALQCGFCTPGFLMAIEPMLARAGGLDDARLRELIGGNLCRCTGYDSIVHAVRLAHGRMAEMGAFEARPPEAAVERSPAAAVDASLAATVDAPRAAGAVVARPRGSVRRRLPALIVLMVLAAAAAIGLRRR